MLQDSADDHAHQITRYLLFLSLSLSRGVLSFGAVVALSPCDVLTSTSFPAERGAPELSLGPLPGLQQIIHPKTVSRGLILWSGVCASFLRTCCDFLLLTPWLPRSKHCRLVVPTFSWIFSGHRSSTFACRRWINPTPRLGMVNTRAADKPLGLANHRATVTNNAAPNQRHARYTPTDRSFENRIGRRAQSRRSRSIHRLVALSLR